MGLFLFSVVDGNQTPERVCVCWCLSGLESSYFGVGVLQQGQPSRYYMEQKYQTRQDVYVCPQSRRSKGLSFLFATNLVV